MAQRCTARSKISKNQCKRWSIEGGTVCIMHGGKAPQVKAAADRRVLAEKALIEFGLSRAKDLNRVLAEVGCIAFVRAGELFDEKGNLIPIHSLPPEVQAAIASTETVKGNIDQGDGQRDTVVRLKLLDKNKALELLAKHHGLLTERLDVQGKIEVKWQE